MENVKYKTDYFSLFITAAFSVAISIAGVTYLLNNGLIGAASSDDKVVVLDTMAAVQKVPFGTPGYEATVEKLMLKGRDIANDLAAAGYIVLDSQTVLRTPASKVVIPELSED